MTGTVWHFDKRLVIGLALVVSLVLVSGALTTWNTNRLNEDAAWVAHTHEVLDLTSDVLRTLLDAETGERGFLLTGKEEYLQPYASATENLAGLLRTLREKTSDNHSQQERIQRLKEMAALRMNRLEEGIALRRKSMEDVQASLATGKGKAQMDAIREVIAEIEKEEQNLLKKRQQLSRRSYLVAQTSALLTAALGLLMVGADYALLRRSLSARQVAAQQLHEQREWFRTTLTSIGDAVIVTDVKGRITFLNPVAESLTGWSRDEAAGLALVTVFNIINQQSRQPVEDPTARALREGAIVGLANHTILIAKDGSERPIEDSAAPIRAENGDVTGVVLVFRDAAERRAAEAAARKYQEILQLVHRIGKIGHWEWNALTDENKWSPEMEALYGLPPGGFEGGYQGWAKLLHPDDLPKAAEDVRRALETGNYFTEFRVIWPDGSVHWLEARAKVLGDGHERPLRIVGVNMDVTERKKMEEALRQSGAQFRQLADAMPQIVWAARPDGYIDYYNERWYEYTGFPRGEYGQQSWEPILHPDDVRRCLETYFGCVKAGQPYQIEYRFKDRKTGGYRWHLGRALPVRDESGQIVRWLGTCTDIDDTKKAGERLRLLWEAAAVMLSSDEPDAMLRELFANLGPHFGLDAYCNFVVNETGDALRLLSATGIPEEAANKIARLEFGQAICGAVALSRRSIVATHVQQSDDPRVQLVKSFGIRAYVCNPLQIDNTLLGTLSFASRSRDAFDPEELDFLRTICHYVAVAYERLRLVRQLQDADRRKDEFLATLAHELRNPLAPLRNALELLRRSDGDALLREQARSMMGRQLDQMVRLIDDLLDMSRISRGKVELRKERVDLAAVVRSAVETARPLLEAQNHELTMTVPPQPLYLDADPTRLAQVIANLLNNAAKYTEKEGHICLAAERKGNEAVVSVRDNGIGIAADHLPHLFEMFSQVAPALERSQGGLGIGLSLVRGLVELHGGRVEARSDGIGKGSAFVVRLPIVDVPAAGAPQELALDSNVPRGRKRRILAVDDNRDAADSLAMILQMMGHETCTAYDGVEAVQAAAHFHPEVVLLDIGLPKMNGYKVASQIRQQQWGKGMALIALTGWGQEEDKRRAFEAGFDYHLTKPVDAAALEKLITLIRPVSEH